MLDKHALDVPAALAQLDAGGARREPDPHATLSYAEHLYNLRAHIELVRQRIQKLSSSGVI